MQSTKRSTNASLQPDTAQLPPRVCPWDTVKDTRNLLKVLLAGRTPSLTPVGKQCGRLTPAGDGQAVQWRATGSLTWPKISWAFQQLKLGEENIDGKNIQNCRSSRRWDRSRGGRGGYK